MTKNKTLKFTFADGSSYSSAVYNNWAPGWRRIYYSIAGNKLNDFYARVTDDTEKFFSNMYQSVGFKAEQIIRHQSFKTAADAVIALGEIGVGDNVEGLECGVIFPISLAFVNKYSAGTTLDTRGELRFCPFFDLDNYIGKIHYNKHNVSTEFIKKINQKERC
jgi:hypothetical protein